MKDRFRSCSRRKVFPVGRNYKHEPEVVRDFDDLDSGSEDIATNRFRKGGR